MKKSNLLFYILIFLLPLNLGKHFISTDSYVRGLLIDYLIPTLYIQDILILLILFFWLKDLVIKKMFPNIFSRNFIFMYFFMFSVSLTIFVSPLPFVSLLSFFRLVLYFLLFLYIIFNIKDIEFIKNILIISFFLISLLGIIQFIKQGALFNNYLFFGEQPYTASTLGITLENIGGYTKVPAYGLFRHPNIFGGLLSIVLIWTFVKTIRSRKYWILFIPMFLSLILTFSIFSYISFVLGLLIYITKLPKNFICIILAFVFVFSIAFPFFIQLDSFPSFYRRERLLEGSFLLLKDNFLYGVGFNTFTVAIEDVLPYMGVVRFLQPVHNVFILLLVETGVFSLIFFLCFLLKTFINIKNSLFIISFFQIIFLSCFDHYFLTIHQSLLFLIVFLSLCWTSASNYFYNGSNE